MPPDVTIAEEQGNLYLSVPEFHLSLNHHYDHWKGGEAKEFLEACYKQASMLKRAVEHRQTTLIAIMEVLIAKQRRFFTDGPAVLKPLTIKEVSEELLIHESTVSRAVKDKMIQAPVGIVPLQRLFSSKLSTVDGPDVSSAEVKHLLFDYINKEDKRKPLSDHALAEMLKKTRGILISRRTVAKYRKLENIPSSSARRKHSQW
ncbi:hypothetical protein MUN89_03215 [Halobacillus salinarum]|uniref:RNA polymerase sigma factor 54 DNA-binding domain-containing protein n=1 Tax=Halobacillus salinarum TaxID=2932257 RepID=A0ABY4ELV3_9BACI|nr:hypothetical protein [Halobacillus salinarum]UOQ44975.1 hypothetical protein MUN89_03215 [Halobacillus salinarum]